MTKMKSKQRMGPANGRWQGGKSADYRRRVTGAKRGELVHHANGNKADNSRSNFKVLKPSRRVTAIGKHNKAHPEKGKK